MKNLKEKEKSDLAQNSVNERLLGLVKHQYGNSIIGQTANTTKEKSDQSDSSSDSSDSEEERKKKKKAKKEKKKMKKEMKKEKKRKKKREKRDKEDKEINKLKDTKSPSVNGATKKMAPMTKEEWDKKQSVVRRVYDEDTGRSRLVKGDGEILEECVSKERQMQINRDATKQDGNSFQKHLAKAL